MKPVSMCVTLGMSLSICLCGETLGAGIGIGQAIRNATDAASLAVFGDFGDFEVMGAAATNNERPRAPTALPNQNNELFQIKLLKQSRLQSLIPDTIPPDVNPDPTAPASQNRSLLVDLDGSQILL